MFYKKHLKVNLKNATFYRWNAEGTNTYTISRGVCVDNAGVPVYRSGLSFINTCLLVNVDSLGSVTYFRTEEVSFNEVLEASTTLFLNFDECVQNLYQHILRKRGKRIAEDFAYNIKQVKDMGCLNI